MRASTIFKSRWWALLWAAGIVWFAVDTAGDGGGGGANTASANETGVTDATGQPVSDDDVRQLGDALNTM